MTATLLDHALRDATPDDARALAELANFAGDGLPLFLWGRMARAGESAWDVGVSRARRAQGSFSYANATIAEAGGVPAACLIGYPVPDEPEPVDYGAMPPMFVPLQELENMAPGTWYVNVLAAYPRFRGMGLGTRLIALARERAAWAGRLGISIIVSDANHGARRLYLRCGCAERASRPMVSDGWENPGRNWVLLTDAPAG